MATNRSFAQGSDVDTVAGNGLTMDAQTLQKVKMPNRDGFVTFSRGK